MSKIKIIILFFISFNSSCIFNKSTVYYNDEEETYAVCGDCKALKKVNMNVKYVEAYDKKCIIPKGFSVLTNIEKLMIVANDIDFTYHTVAMDSLQHLVIHDNIFGDIPKFIYKSKKINWLLLNLKDGNAIKEELKNLQNVKYLKLIFNELSSFPEPILSLTKLEELHIKVLDGGLIDIPMEFSKLQQLEIVELPIDASKHLDILVSLPNCKEFSLKTFSDIDDHLNTVKDKFISVDKFHISELPKEDRAKLAEALPYVNMSKHSHFNK